MQYLINFGLIIIYPILIDFIVKYADSAEIIDNDQEGVKIVGGSLANEGEFPYQVSLRTTGNRHFCGGSIIDEKWILTAAHCLSGFSNEDITAVVGTNKLDEGGDFYKSLKLIGHPNYSQFLIRNDIGLIEVDKPIVYGDNVKPIALPNEDFKKSGDDEIALLSGWGTTSYPGKVPNELQQIKLSVIEQKECLNTSFRVTENNICTLNKEGEGACHGDSGGPLVSEDHQIGIVSWGTPCAKGKPDVFTRVYSYIDWINNHVKKNLTEY